MSRVNARMRRYRGGWNALEAFDVVCLLDSNATDNPTIYDVTFDGGIPLLESTNSSDATGLVTIWTQSGSAPAPYHPDPKAASGTIQPGGVTACTPDSLSIGANELIQARVKLRLIDTATPSGAVIDDFSLRAYLPGSTAVWGTSNTKGLLNARRQVGNPADAISAPLQGTNQANPNDAVHDGWDSAHQTEVWWYGVNSQPRFEIVYNGASATPAGIAIALEVSGYRYLLAVHPSGNRGIRRGGVRIMLPDDVEADEIIAIPTAGRSASTS